MKIRKTATRQRLTRGITARRNWRPPDGRTELDKKLVAQVPFDRARLGRTTRFRVLVDLGDVDGGNVLLAVLADHGAGSDLASLKL